MDEASDMMEAAGRNYDRALEADWMKDPEAYARYYGELENRTGEPDDGPIPTEEEWRQEQIKEAWQTGHQPQRRQERW